MSTSEDRDSASRSPIDWLAAAAWPMRPADRKTLEQLRRKDAAGDLTPKEHAQATAIIQSARRNVHDESRVKRRESPDERTAEVEKRVAKLLAPLLKAK